MAGKGEHLVSLAVRGILARLGPPVGGPARIVCSETKVALGEALATAFRAQGLFADLALLPRAPDGAAPSPLRGKDLQRAAQAGSLVILADPPQARWLFETVGRPDRGLYFPAERFYCDWLMPLDSLLRVLSADYGHVCAWRDRLLNALEGAERPHVSTRAGTELTLTPRGWLAVDGEVFTAPWEDSVQGLLALDGALYDDAPANPVLLRVAGGRVVDAATFDCADPRQRLLYDDLTRDAGAAQVAELGLGVSPAARPCAPIMEAEMALGTCHVGFGHNVPYGGLNSSATHVDVGLLQPTIRVDGRVICRAGVYRL